MCILNNIVTEETGRWRSVIGRGRSLGSPLKASPVAWSSVWLDRLSVRAASAFSDFVVNLPLRLFQNGKKS